MNKNNNPYNRNPISKNTKLRNTERAKRNESSILDMHMLHLFYDKYWK